MNNSDFKDFGTMLQATMALYQRGDLTEPVLSMWWQALRGWPLDSIRQAISEHISESKWAPTPADIIGRMQSRDGRPDAEEAWATASRAKDEAETVVWTEETAQAWGVAIPLMDAGDEVGARMAFLEKYRSLVSEARRRGDPVRVTVSPGRDPERREIAVQDAYDRGMLGHDNAARILGRDPADDTPQLPSATQQLARLRDDSELTEEQRQRAQEHLAELRAKFAGGRG